MSAARAAELRAGRASQRCFALMQPIARPNFNLVEREPRCVQDDGARRARDLEFDANFTTKALRPRIDVERQSITARVNVIGEATVRPRWSNSGRDDWNRCNGQR